MPKGILIALDSTASSERAVLLGVRWAQKCDALLVGLVVVDEESLRGAEPVPLGVGIYKKHKDGQLVGMARRQVEQYLEHFALKCAEAKVACKLLEDTGSPRVQIVKEAERYDLIMLGNKLQFQFSIDYEEYAALRGVLKMSPRPVVVVPEQGPHGKNVIVAYDGSAQAARTLQGFLAADLPGYGEIHVLSVGPDRVEAARRGDRAVEFLRLHNSTARLHAIESSAAPADVLLEHIAALGAGLVVMGAYGQPTWGELVFGSTTRRMLRDSSVPLFLSH